MKENICEQTAYLSITTTDDQVHTYITSVMEVIHDFQNSWNGIVQSQRCRRLPQERNPVQPIRRRIKRKVKERVKVNPRVHLFPIKERERVEKVKERTNRKERAIMLVGRTGIKGAPAVPIAATPASSSTTVVDGQKKRPKQCVHYASATGCLRGKDCIHIKTIQWPRNHCQPIRQTFKGWMENRR